MSHKHTAQTTGQRAIATIEIGDAVSTHNTRWVPAGYDYYRAQESLKESVRKTVELYRGQWCGPDVPAKVEYRTETRTTTMVKYQSTKTELASAVTL